MSGLISACAPYQQQPSPTPPSPTALGARPPTVNSPEQKQLEQSRRDAERRLDDSEALNGGGEEGTTTNAPPSGGKTDFPKGIKIPGKEGFVFNPYNNNPVDVRGIPPGTLVRDPQDPDPDHKFRVP